MKALVVGEGAREHAICWKLARSNRISGLYAAPGNAGAAGVADCLPDISSDDVEAISRFAVDAGIDLVLIGPESALAAGLVDALAAEGIAAIGPDRAAAQLEASKAFAKSFMSSYNIPTASYRTFRDENDAERHIRTSTSRLVVKKSGLAGGKGVFEANDTDRLVESARAIVRQNDEVIVEEFLSGSEISVFALTDGTDHLVLPVCADYKKAGVGGTGPNTGGMGAVCPVPWITPDELDTIERTIVVPTFAGIADAGLSYRGVLYFGLMMTGEGPKVLEYNVRFGDPETQVLLPLLRSDFTNWCDAMIAGTLGGFPASYADASAVGVVVASAGYPDAYERNLVVSRLGVHPDDEAMIFHASTHIRGGQLLTGGGRCFTAVGIGRELLTARSRAYSAARGITFPGSWYRPDIGGRIFGG